MTDFSTFFPALVVTLLVAVAAGVDIKRRRRNELERMRAATMRRLEELKDG